MASVIGSKAPQNSRQSLGAQETEGLVSFHHPGAIRSVQKLVVAQFDLCGADGREAMTDI